MKTKSFKGTLLSILIIASITALATSLLSPGSVHASLTSHSPILISGDAGFTPANGVNGGGSGTAGNPYIIENWVIDASGAHGIQIQNTTKYFVIRNCLVENGRSNYHNGISLINVVNGRIENTICKNNANGIYLGSSHNNTLDNNTLTGNYYGFYVYSSNNNRIENNIILATTYSNYASCPLLYTWNGAGMNLIGDINGPGALGYGGKSGRQRVPTSTDYTAIKGSYLVPKDGSYTLEVAEDQDEITYLDNAELWIIDHSPDVTIYSPEAALNTITPYLYPPVIHTVKNPVAPVSATDWKGNDVLPIIASPDGVYTQPEPPTDSYITLDLGDLSSASQIKLVYRAYIDWASKGGQGDVYAEVKNASGEWETVSEFGRPEAMPRTFVMDITNWFKTNDYQMRIHTGKYNIHVDWIAVDTSLDEPVTVTVLKPTSANLYYKGPEHPGFEYFFGNFTKYGDVLPLLQNADDEFVIMRAGDSVELKFDAQSDPAEGRDFMLVTDAYFKQPFIKKLFGSDISTVNPLPFHAMSNYPYSSSESYPSDAEHLAYLSEWNTREYVDGGSAGISLPYSDNNTVFGNTIIGTPSSIGLLLDTETNTRILNNIISNTLNGIEVDFSNNITVKNNIVENNSNNGISLNNSSNNSLENNVCENYASYGIQLQNYCNNNTITGNTCGENGDGGIRVYLSNYNTIENNTCENNSSDGIYLETSNHTTISNNTCENSFTGITLRYSNNNNVLYNTITGNHRGFYVWYSNNNQIDNNTVLATSTMNFGSCPFLYTWDGTEVKFFGDINGAGGLGYRVDMSIYGGGIVLRPPTSTDYTAINGSDLAPKDGSYTLQVAEDSNEITYLDNAELWVIDHDPGVQIYSPEAALETTAPYLYPPVIHTVRNPTSPVSATDWRGNDILPVIASPDEVYTQAELLTDSFITLDLGNLENAKQIKLIYRAYSDWSPIGNVKADQYAEVKNASGEWELVSGTEHFGKPETFPRTYVIDITDWFKTNDWHLRLHTGQYKIHVDWIAVDTSVDEPVTVTVLKPTSANLYYKGPANPGFEYFFGNFTKYGDVLPLLQNADDEFVIMRAGDSVELKFDAQSDPVEGRDFVLVTDAYFKQPFVKYLLGSDVSTVDPLPFHGMSNYPYSSSESYPSDPEHLAYLSEWNTREYVDGGNAGMSLPYSENNTVSGNTIIGDNTSTGLYLTFENDTRILNNVISNTNEGLYIELSHGIVVENNQILNNNHNGIHLFRSDNCTLENNTLDNNGQNGIYLDNSEDSIIAESTISNSDNDGIRLNWSENNRISSNTVERNWTGIRLDNSDKNLIENNIVVLNWTGIWLDPSDNNLIINNTCENNKEGIYLSFSENNLIYHNNFIHNMTNAYDTGSNDWDNGYPSGGNYWDDYNGVDENQGPFQDLPGSDGIGDTPYDIPGDCNRDRYPLMSPWGAIPVIRGVEVSISPKENDGAPCMTLEYIVTVRNTGNVNENYLLSWTDNAGWGDNIWLSDNWLWVTIGGENTAKLYVHIPLGALGGTRDNITVTARSKQNGDVKDNDSCIARVKRYLTSLVTNSGLCYFDTDPSRAGQQFRLIFTQNLASPNTYKLAASNPGQFYYNVFYYGNPGNKVDNLKITIPYPFVTQGSVPIHFYDNFENVGGCLVPHGELGGFTVTGTNTLTPSGALGISLSDYDNGLKENVTITVSGLFPSSGLVYVTIHLDYGLKGKDGYTKGADNNAMNTPTATIINLDNYNFSVSVYGIKMDNQRIQNVNVFKRDPGFAGMVTDSQGNPRANVKVQIYGPDGRLLATVYTDVDGYYSYAYKATGKAATYTLKLPSYNQTKSVTVKANSLVEVNFVI